MTTAELTTQINRLTVAERRQVGIFVDTLIDNRGADEMSAYVEAAIRADADRLKKADLQTRLATGFYTEEEMTAHILKSVEEAKEGHTSDAFKDLAEVREEYDL